MNGACLCPPLHLTLQLLVRHRQAASQAAFARAAARSIGCSERHLACPCGAGLVLYAASEPALEPLLEDLHAGYPGCLEHSGPQVRHIDEDGLLHPVMHARMRIPLGTRAAVRGELLGRGADILEEDVVMLSYAPAREAVVRALAPMARLIGFPARLRSIAGASAQLLIALDRYAPLPQRASELPSMPGGMSPHAADASFVARSWR